MRFKDSYPTAQEARTALYKAGFYPRHSERRYSEWRRLNNAYPVYVVAQRPSGDFEIVER